MSIITHVKDLGNNWREFQYCYEYFLRPSLEAVALRRPDGTPWLTHDYEHVFDRVAKGHAMFWSGEECAFITEVYQSPTGLRSHHTWLAGGSLEPIVAAMPLIEQWGIMNGCHRQTGSGRRGWLRKFTGYEEIGVRKQKSLLVA